MVSDIRIAGFPHIYIQGPGALARLPECMEAIAAKGRVAIIADPIVESQFRDVSERLHDAGCEVIQYPFGGECTRAEIDRLAGLARDLEPHVVIGAGGGKALDTAKGVVMELGCSLVIVPTIASSDAPTSRLIAIYDEHHNIAETPSLKRNPHAVVVDTTILAAAPRRFLAAGIGDALTKKFEVASTIKSNRLNYFGGRPPGLASVLADQCYEIIRADAVDALAAAGTGTPNAAFERVVEACILYSGLSFESGGLSIAHGILRGLAHIPQTQAFLHGEVVTYGVLVQLATMGHDDAYIRDIIGFCREVGLPTRLSEIGVTEYSDNDIVKMAEPISKVPYVVKNDPPISMQMIVDGVKRLERIAAL
ncbi:glycerol dehydrogenase [Oricola nitratireducens]|uniref:glycerol dehydrogenase n=1 Tax=Oricola nitratireducens TaxID=2775868 RepID=UPI001867AED4|nr:glycerol dehydrogenase [Oricola nitratireducens]